LHLRTKKRGLMKGEKRTKENVVLSEKTIIQNKKDPPLKKKKEKRETVTIWMADHF